MGNEARALAARLRASDTEALTLLRDALQLCDGAIGGACEALGFAGPSTLWRIAYATPSVRDVIRTHGRRRGAHTKGRRR